MINFEIDFTDESIKPKDWPRNQREADLSNVYNVAKDFINNPNYKTKEILVSLIVPADINETSNIGMHRVTQYETAVINALYFMATRLSFFSLKIYLYRRITETTRLHKMLFQMSKTLGQESQYTINEYLNLDPRLRMFYMVYANYILEENRSFPSHLVYEINRSLLTITNKDVENDICEILITLFNDLGGNTSLQTFPELKWSRADIKGIFSLISNLIKQTNQEPCTRPLRGVLCMSLSNWILKSRNNYNEDYLYKCMSDKASISSFHNQEIWMQKVEYLNDKREKGFIKELFKTKEWVPFSWARNINFNQCRESFVCSFVKGEPDAKMLTKYGRNVYGYKTDRIIDVLSPITIHPNYGLMLGQTVCYDIIYDINNAKKELNFLFELIDLLQVDDSNKNEILNCIIPYWILSFKDKKWETEKERRYELVIQNREFIETTIDERFLKQKSTILTYPDFVEKKHIRHLNIKLNRIEKINALSVNDCLFCNDCLQSDYDAFTFGNKNNLTCSICKSENTIILPAKKRN